MNREWPLALLAAGCGAAGSPPEPAHIPARTAGLSAPMVFSGACDASGAAGIGGSRVAVADDEDNALRLYDTAAPGPPIQTVDTRAMEDARGKHPEMDLEGAARIGQRVYWLASHGRKKSGKRAPSRLRVFATDIDPSGGLVLVGRPYSLLVDDLAALPGRGPDLARAAMRSPKEEGGLNIEGLGATPAGALLLGFRSPVRGGRALVIPVENPAAIVERGERARLGEAMELDLGGRGIRAIEEDGAGGFWMVGGATVGRQPAARLYRWDGRGEARWVRSVAFGDLNPEALAMVGGRLLIHSDDGERDMGGTACKKLKDAPARRFRAVWLE